MGGKRCVRGNVYTSEYYEQKLKLLANSCDLSAAAMGSLIVCKLLDSRNFVRKTQESMNTIEHYWITADFDENNRVIYKQEMVEHIERKIIRHKNEYLDFPRERQLKFSYRNEHDLKLSLLARSCNLRKSELAALSLHYGLDSSEVVMYFQERYNIHPHLWVAPVQINGAVKYIFSP